MMNTVTSAPTPIRPMERIGTSADRVFRLTTMVDEFLDRFHGPRPEQDSGGADAISVSYGSNIDRLTGNLDTLETRIAALSQIG